MNRVLSQILAERKLAYRELMKQYLQQKRQVQQRQQLWGRARLGKILSRYCLFAPKFQLVPSSLEFGVAVEARLRQKFLNPRNSG